MHNSLTEVAVLEAVASYRQHLQQQLRLRAPDLVHSAAQNVVTFPYSRYLKALLSVDFISRYLSPETMEVANRILALLLAAPAMETILNGLDDALGALLEGAVKRLQEMGVLGK